MKALINCEPEQVAAIEAMLESVGLKKAVIVVDDPRADNSASVVALRLVCPTCVEVKELNAALLAANLALTEEQFKNKDLRVDLKRAHDERVSHLIARLDAQRELNLYKLCYNFGDQPVDMLAKVIDDQDKKIKTLEDELDLREKYAPYPLHTMNAFLVTEQLKNKDLEAKISTLEGCNSVLHRRLEETEDTFYRSED